jgi:hypothetical protein
MSEIDNLLEEVEQLIINAKPREAEERVRSLLSTIGDTELRIWEVDLRRTINRFLPKRRRALTAALDQRLGKAAAASEDDAVPPPHTDIDLQQLAEVFAADLEELSEHHIFQWSTFYRDRLSSFFDQFFDGARHAGEVSAVLTMARHALTMHAREIFQKGFNYVTLQSHETPQYAITKSLHGLQRFLDLPIEFYSTKLSIVRDTASARILRSLCSAMVGAILEGYSSVRFNRQSGTQVLPRFPRSWAYALPFLTSSDLSGLLTRLEPGDFRDGLINSVNPFIEALDELAGQATDYVPLPALAQLMWDLRRLDTSLHPPPYAAEPQLIEAQCYLDASYVQRGALEEAASRDVGVVVAPLRPDLQTLVGRNERLNRIVVPIADESAPGVSSTRHRVISALEYTIYRRRSPRVAAQPLRYNFAREFPLHNPFLTRYFHVYRSSVRELLRTFERRNGVRLWCSVRRSGKTTGCLDLGSSTGQSVVVSQTCASTGQIPDGNIFYDDVCKALADGRQLALSFFRDVITRCAFDRGSDEDRFVFVLDEYETLFGRLRAALRREPELQYTVVQPLLDQLVAFTRDNLLVFLGQQPNAHFILMDQNQLSAYVEQDSFPLFRHDRENIQGEFAELIRKVLIDRADFDLGFVNAIFSETAGHPFLTVNLLVEFVDWLIETNRPVAALSLSQEDVVRFWGEKLQPARVSLSPEYRFFREAITEATSPEGKRHTPWLHAIYTCLHEMASSSPETFSCSRADFASIVDSLQLQELGLGADLILSTGSQANFLEYDENNVWPKIKLLGRIAAVSRGRVTA